MKALLTLMFATCAVVFSLGSSDAPATSSSTQPQLAESSEPADGVCPYSFVCDDPYRTYQTLRGCSASCSTACDLMYTCDP